MSNIIEVSIHENAQELKSILLDFLDTLFTELPEAQIKNILFQKCNNVRTLGNCHRVAKCEVETQCSICLEDLKHKEYKRTLKCSHVFHKKCVDKWLKYNDECPLCRINVFDEFCFN